MGDRGEVRGSRHASETVASHVGSNSGGRRGIHDQSLLGYSEDLMHYNMALGAGNPAFIMFSPTTLGKGPVRPTRAKEGIVSVERHCRPDGTKKSQALGER